MIQLTQNSENNVILTLSESVTYTGSPIYFLFRFYNLTTHDEKLFTAADISTNIIRYNQFNIILTGNTFQNLTAGTISMAPDGETFYEVYEQINQTNLALSGTSGIILESGIVQVKGTNLNRITYSYSGTPNIYLGYQP